MPKWLIVLAGLGCVVLATWAGYWLSSSHRQSVVQVSQEKVAKASGVAKTYGTVSASEKVKEGGDHLTILFFYDGYGDESLALRHIGLMQGALKNTQPFATSDVIDTKVITSGSQRCKVERRAQKILVCDKSLINEINKLKLKRFKLVVLSPLEFVPNATSARGKNSAMYLPAYKGALTDEELNIFLTRFFLHELGHGLGLKDEYAFERTKASSTEQHSDNIAYQPSRPNCAPDVETAKQWWSGYETAEKKVGYHQGCAGDKRYVYPYTETLMSDNPQDADYGKVSEDYLRGILDCFYGGKEAISYLDSNTKIPGRPVKCHDFKAMYPDFWQQ